MRNDRYRVLDRFAPLLEAPEPSFERFVRRRDRKRRNQRIASGLVGVAVFVAVVAAIWVATGGAFDRTPRPATPEPTGLPAPTRGFIGLPTEGVTPSTPARGDLVLKFFGRSTTDGGPLIQAWVYADGRLIWSKEGDFSYGANALTTGFLERRLTPEGVELMRSEIVSTRLFEDDLRLRAPVGSVIGGSVGLREGDRLITVSWTDGHGPFGPEGKAATPEQESALRRLDALLNPLSWLPASAWEDPQIKAFVPSRYAACAEGQEIERMITRLPAPARDLLSRPVAKVPPGWETQYCWDLSTEEARTLVEVLDSAGVVPVANTRLHYQTAGTILRANQIWFEPYLPHGEMECLACGG